MALIKCKECNEQISSQAVKCPKCGARLHKVQRSFFGKVCKLIFILFNIFMIWVILAAVSSVMNGMPRVEHGYMDTVILIIVISLTVYYFLDKKKQKQQQLPEKPKAICKACGTRGQPETKLPGNGFIELVLWLCYLIPGLIYSIWRRKSAYNECSICHSKDLVPEESPVGKKLAAELGE